MSDTLPPLPEAQNDNRSSGRAGFHAPYGPAYTADQMRSYAAAALAAAVAEPVAAGFKMVPLEPTPEQIALLDPWMRPEAALELLRSVFAVALAAPACCCGEPTATGVVHRRDGPCFLAEAAAVAEPVAKQCEWTNCPTRVGNVCCNDRAAPAAPPQREPYDQTALGLCNACGWKAVGPDGCLNCAPQREREPPPTATEAMVRAGMKRMFEDKQYSAPWEVVIERMYEAMIAAAPAAPPQREPLTDADIDAACAGIECSNVDLGVYDRLIARAIERAHGIAPASAPKEQT